ncbi:MAG: cytochrome b/b6 domain-containing protein [Taibaiella sp.]|nr:cytochrome b/b6 domain-containing protein [Taibaiella sp.]
MKRLIKKHPLAIRWFHWVNFPVLLVMVWSGLLIYWANDVYKIGWGDTTLVKFFPKSFYQALNVPFKLSQGMAFHFLFMWLFFINGLLYVLYTFFSGEWRLLIPEKKSFKEAWQVVLHDLHLKRGLPPQEKYNAAQRVAYSAIIVMGLGSLLTGLAIYKPVQFSFICAICGGYEFARILHFSLTIGYVLFFLLHIVQVALAGWNNFRAMVTGLEVIKDAAPATVITAVKEQFTIESTKNEGKVEDKETTTNETEK